MSLYFSSACPASSSSRGIQQKMTTCHKQGDLTKKILAAASAIQRDLVRKKHTPVEANIKETFNSKAIVIMIKRRDASLHSAARNDSVEAMKALLAFKANIQAKNQRGATPLHIAAAYGCMRAVRLLVDKQALIEEPDAIGRTPLHLAASNHHSDVVAFLLAKKANVRAVDSKGWTPLHWAAYDNNNNGDEETLEILLQYSADRNALDNHQRTPCDIAKESRHMGFVELLSERVDLIKSASIDLHHLKILEKSSDLRVEVSTEKYTVFYNACREGALDKIQNLVETQEVAVHNFDRSGRNALHIAARYGRLHVMQYLLTKEVDIAARDLAGFLPLHLAARYVALCIQNEQEDLKTLAELMLPLLGQGSTLDTPSYNSLSYDFINDNAIYCAELIVDIGRYSGQTARQILGERGMEIIAQFLN